MKEPDLFEIADIAEAREKPPAECRHQYEEKTETIWPGETHLRLTWTCKACGRIRGRA